MFVEAGEPASTVTVTENGSKFDLTHGSVVIAAITKLHQHVESFSHDRSWNLAKKAVERGLEVKPWVKTSLAPGSRVVTDYLKDTGLMPYSSG